MKKFVFFFFLSCFSLLSFGEIRLPVIFSDGLVLQRDTEFEIYGWASPGETVKLFFNGLNSTVKTGKDGRWKILMKPQKAGGPFEMVFRGKNEIKVKNILFGDVWLCSGQSNMVLPMERIKENYPEEIASANFPEIRHFFISTKTNLTGPAEDLPPGNWKEANSTDVLGFSATAYFFARKVYTETKVPIGLINASVGGTPIEAWIGEPGFQEFPDILKTIVQNKDTAFIASKKQAGSGVSRSPQLKDKGLLESPKWFEEEYVPKGWNSINIPGYWEDQGVRDVNGVVWYRREIQVPESITGVPAKLFMGRIVDADEVYINGTKVGNITYQYPPRRYNLAAGILKPGKNTIVIRVTNNSGKGGFVPDKPYFLLVNQKELDLKGTWQYKVGEVYESVSGGFTSFSAQNQPTALYNAMVAPVIQQKIRGMIWYQGETNAGNPAPYTDYMKALISSWRKSFQNPDLPFLFVQLANFMDVDYMPTESNWAELRFAQFKALSVQKTAMAVAIDLGEWNDIHPLNKKDVGERLALGALKLAYKKEIVHSGPLFESAEKVGNKIIINFKETGSGLITSDGEELRRFEIAGTDSKYVWAKAKIEGKKVEVWCDDVENPVKVRYAWCDNPRDANLCNREGLPASPFETGD